LAAGAVADLVVVLEVAEERVAGHAGRRAAVRAAAERRVAAGIDPGAAQRRGDVGERAEVGVVAVALATEYGVQRVMEVVAPLRVEPVATALARPQQARIVE